MQGSHCILTPGPRLLQIPFWGKWLEHQNPGGKPPCDWFGVNYYSR